jgi:hypothetical protein
MMTARRTAPGATGFQSNISPIGPALKALMDGRSLRPGCPVTAKDLSYVEVSYFGFDDATHEGELVVATRHARDIVSVFKTLYEEKFPIYSMRLVDHYDGSDSLSMAANNTSAFNGRPVTGGSAFSQHTFGAIDINPVQNPYIKGDVIEPTAAEAYLARDAEQKGLITPGSIVVRAFADIGWSWGGDWTSLKDYQHFSENGG